MYYFIIRHLSYPAAVRDLVAAPVPAVGPALSAAVPSAEAFCTDGALKHTLGDSFNGDRREWPTMISRYAASPCS